MRSRRVNRLLCLVAVLQRPQHSSCLWRPGRYRRLRLSRPGGLQNPIDGGIVQVLPQLLPPKYSYLGADSITLKAVPAMGYVFQSGRVMSVALPTPASRM